jgi:hypothetical protein
MEERPGKGKAGVKKFVPAVFSSMGRTPYRLEWIFRLRSCLMLAIILNGFVFQTVHWKDGSILKK